MSDQDKAAGSGEYAKQVQTADIFAKTSPPDYKEAYYWRSIAAKSYQANLSNKLHLLPQLLPLEMPFLKLSLLLKGSLVQIAICHEPQSENDNIGENSFWCYSDFCGQWKMGGPMESDDQKLEDFRKKIRDDLHQQTGLGGGPKSFRQRLGSELRLTGLILVILIVILLPAIVFFKSLPMSEIGSELSSLFVPWLFSCMGDDCPELESNGE